MPNTILRHDMQLALPGPPFLCLLPRQYTHCWNGGTTSEATAYGYSSTRGGLERRSNQLQASRGTCPQEKEASILLAVRLRGDGLEWLCECAHIVLKQLQILSLQVKCFVYITNQAADAFYHRYTGITMPHLKCCTSIS